MSDIDIAQLARRSGVRASALRYYEDKGLITSSGRRGLKRLFDPEVLERLSLIGLAQAAGFSLEEIAAMLAGEGGPRIDKADLAAKADVLDAKIADLTRMRDGLRHASACQAPELMGCPHFRRIVRVVGSEAARRARSRFRVEAV